MLSAAHSPVMTEEVVKALGPSEDSILVDATFGRGGHTRALLKYLGLKGRIYAMDRDPEACAIARDWAEGESRLTVIQAPFSKLSDELIRAGIAGQVSGIVLDLGVSSPQLDNAERGFSFMRDGPLDMRMGQSGMSAADIVNSVEEKVLADLIYLYGEERASRRIARNIVKSRENLKFETTFQLVKVIEASLPRPKPGQTHPATRTFQALRIAVNDELGQLVSGLRAAENILCEGGLLAVVTFHSLEDRIVKRFIQGKDRLSSEIQFRLVGGKPIKPKSPEVNRNP